MASTQTSSGGVGFCGLLGTAFIVLKLCGVIHWSWWWVTCPLWGPIAIVVAVLLIALVAFGVVGMLS